MLLGFAFHFSKIFTIPSRALQGSYYASVFGYCTPQKFVLNNATDGPCAYAQNTKFNITVTLFPSEQLYYKFLYCCFFFLRVGAIKSCVILLYL